MLCCLRSSFTSDMEQENLEYTGPYPLREDQIVRIFGQEVKAFSSQYGAEERMSYAAQNLAGECTIYPSYGDFTQACVFRTYGPWWKMAPSAPKPFRKIPNPHDLCSEDFIDVLFEERIYPVAVQVYETYNPGAIVRILGCDHQAGTNVDTGFKNRWRVLWSRTVQETPRKVRIFSPPIKRIDTPINLIRLELNHKLLDYYTELDSILLCGVHTAPSTALFPNLRAQVTKVPGEWPDSDNQGGDSASHNAVNNTCKDSANPSGEGEAIKDCAGSVREESMAMKFKNMASCLGDEEVTLGMDSLHISREEETNGHLFGQLPGEIIIMILGYLDLISLGQVAKTCRLLQRHAYDPILYTEVSFQPVWNLMSEHTLEGLSHRCDHLQRLNLSWCNNYSSTHKDGFLRLLQNSKSTLTCLQLSCCSLGPDTLRYISTHCTLLKELDLSGCSGVDKITAIALIKLNDMERLNLYRTDIDTHTTICVIRSMPKLKHLNLGSCKLVSNMAAVVEELGNCCPDLRSLDMWRARNLDNEAFQRFIKKCSMLEELDVGWCSELSSRADSFTIIAENCLNLKKLFLTANRTVCDHDILHLAKYSHQLQQLDILGTREVSTEAMDMVLKNCRDLVMVDVSFCAGISDMVVSSWRQTYPHVNIKKSFQN